MMHVELASALSSITLLSYNSKKLTLIKLQSLYAFVYTKTHNNSSQSLTMAYRLNVHFTNMWSSITLLLILLLNEAVGGSIKKSA